MTLHTELRIEPDAGTLAAARAWLGAVREALGPQFLAAYLTGSVLTQGFDPKHSRINVLVVARGLPPETLDALARSIHPTKKPPHFDGLFFTRDQIAKSLDVFPIEWLEILERHLRLEGEDLLTGVEVPPANLRLQCEHEMRGKHLQLRQAYLHSELKTERLVAALHSRASSFAALFRTLLRLRGEAPPAEPTRVVERIAQLYGLNAHHLMAAHQVRYSHRRWKADEIQLHYRRFMLEIDRLVDSIDHLRV
jgi:hypothetical protein